MSLAILAANFASLREKMMAEATAAINEEFKKVFETHPELTVIKWTQKIPYFNDGDECVFSVDEFVISNAPDHENVSTYGEYEGDATDVWVISCYGDRAGRYKLVWDLEKFTSSDIGSEVFQTAFDSHSIVTVTKDGIDVSEYEHD